MKKPLRWLFGALILVMGFVVWPWISPKTAGPDTFFSDLGMNVPARFIISHDSPWSLTSMLDKLVLKIPNAQVPAVQKIFAAQSHFEDVTANLPRHYAEFRAGEEQFLPKNCPKRFQAGGFQARDKAREVYICRFLFDRDDPKSTTLYLKSFSPLN